MLMDYKISPTKRSPSIKDACLHRLVAFPPNISDLRLELSAMHISVSLPWLLGQLSLFLMNLRMLCAYTIIPTFIYALVTPTYLHKGVPTIYVQKIQCVPFMYKLGPTRWSSITIAVSVSVYQQHNLATHASSK